MSRSLSLMARRALNAAETDEVFLILLTLTHPDLSEPLRVTSDAVDTRSRGQLFVAYPFDVSLPDDDDGRVPRARLSIDNIDRQAVLALRSMQTPLMAVMEIVRAADPDSIEAHFVDFKLINVRYDAYVLQGDLTIEDFTSEPFPAQVFSPSLFPGLF